MISAARSKTCRICSQPFSPFSSTQTACSVKCAIRVPIIERKATKAKLDSLRPRGYWLRQAQTAFNAWIRERDSLRPCISCNRDHDGAWDAGHYLSTGARPELRFDEENVHRQCVPCNQHLHGNLALFRIGLIARIGVLGVTRLEGPHPALHLSVENLKEIRDIYRKKMKPKPKADPFADSDKHALVQQQKLQDHGPC